MCEYGVYRVMTAQGIHFVRGSLSITIPTPPVAVAWNSTFKPISSCLAVGCERLISKKHWYVNLIDVAFVLIPFTWHVIGASHMTPLTGWSHTAWELRRGRGNWYRGIPSTNILYHLLTDPTQSMCLCSRAGMPGWDELSSPPVQHWLVWHWASSAASPGQQHLHVATTHSKKQVWAIVQCIPNYQHTCGQSHLAY